MAKRSKKKNPSALSAKDRENIEFNASLDAAKASWGKRLNITIATVMCVIFVCLLLLPVLNMSFTRSLKDLVGDLVGNTGDLGEEADQDFTMVTTLSFLDILTAMAGGYKDSVEYIAANNNSGMDKSVVENVFRNYVTQEDVDGLDNAYRIAFCIAVAAFAIYFISIAVISVYRGKNKDGFFLALFVVLLFAVSVVQWVFFVIVGAGAADKGQLQPHAGSYFMLAAGITLLTVYIVYRVKIKKLNGQYRAVGDTEN